MDVLLDSLSQAVDKTIDPLRQAVRGPESPAAGAPPAGSAGAPGSSAAPGAPAPPAPPAPPANPARTVQQVVGGVLGLINLPVELMNTGFAVATNSISQALPSFPAATLTCLYVGPPHAHTHPPSLVPPAPPVPLPSLGPILLGTCVRVLINGLPAARAGDLGMAVTCGGLYPLFEIYLGSSKVFIGGMRAARMLDMVRACQPGLAGAPRGVAAAMMAAGQAAALAGIVADGIDSLGASSPAVSEAMALSAAMGAAQMAADAAAMAVRAALGSDPAVPPSAGVVMIGHPNVLIGGFPMINFPNPALMLLEKLGKIGHAAEEAPPPGESQNPEEGQAGPTSCPI